MAVAHDHEAVEGVDLLLRALHEAEDGSRRRCPAPPACFAGVVWSGVVGGPGHGCDERKDEGGENEAGDFHGVRGPGRAPRRQT